MKPKTKKLLMLGLLATLVAATVPAAGLVWCALGFHSVTSHAAPLPLTGGFYDAYAGVLDAVSGEGLVDYGALAADPEPLARVVATLGMAGPQGRPDQYPTSADQLAFYVNAYNALTLFGVVENWPITSVHDVHGRIDTNGGFGFFFTQRFLLDGRRTNLHDLETDLIRGGFGDARIHAAINCASASCPQLAGEPYYPATIHTQLDAAATRFASAPHVVVDSDAREIRLSSIYTWYAGDFEHDAQRFGWGSGVLDWIGHFADEPTRAALDEGRAAGFSVVYVDYDWSLNGVSGG